MAELEQVLGMRPALFASAAQHLTVYSGGAMPDANSADGIVLQAMGVDRPAPVDPDAPPPAGSGTYSIDSRARLADGRRAHVSPLRWQDGAMP